MSSRTFQIGLAGAIALVALRMGLGWHFFQEGAKKFKGDGFTAQYFLEGSKGAYAEYFRTWIPDVYGETRLPQPAAEKRLEDYYARAVGQMQLNEQQKKKAEAVRDRYMKKIDVFHGYYGSDIEEHLLEVARYRRALEDPIRDVRFQRDWIEQQGAKLRGGARKWLAELETLNDSFAADLYAAGGNKVPVAQRFPIALPSYLPVLNTSVKYVVIGVGVLLLLGLCTRFACLAGIGFLMSVIATQPPWVANAAPTYYQIVEVLALFAVAACGAGRIAGLDFVVNHLITRCCGGLSTENKT